MTTSLNFRNPDGCNRGAEAHCAVKLCKFAPPGEVVEDSLFGMHALHRDFKGSIPACDISHLWLFVFAGDAQKRNGQNPIHFGRLSAILRAKKFAESQEVLRILSNGGVARNKPQLGWGFLPRELHKP